MHITRAHGAAALSCLPPKSRKYTVDGACCFTKTLLELPSAALLFPCPALSRRDQAGETKHYVTTKDSRSGAMRETCARLPYKNEKYACASYMQSVGLTLHSQFGTGRAHDAFRSMELPGATTVCSALRIKACFRRGRLLFPHSTIHPPSPKIEEQPAMVSAVSKNPTFHFHG